MSHSESSEVYWIKVCLDRRLGCEGEFCTGLCEQLRRKQKLRSHFVIFWVLLSRPMCAQSTFTHIHTLAIQWKRQSVITDLAVQIKLILMVKGDLQLIKDLPHGLSDAPFLLLFGLTFYPSVTLLQLESRIEPIMYTLFLMGIKVHFRALFGCLD